MVQLSRLDARHVARWHGVRCHRRYTHVGAAGEDMTTDALQGCKGAPVVLCPRNLQPHTAHYSAHLYVPVPPPVTVSQGMPSDRSASTAALARATTCKSASVAPFVRKRHGPFRAHVLTVH